MGEYPETITADAGYGSEENYAYLQQRDIPAYVKYNTFHFEQKKNFQQKYPYRIENMIYQSEEDQYVCPQGKKLIYRETQPKVSANGYEYSVRVYECEDCQGCPVKEECTKTTGNRTLWVRVELQKMKKTAHDRLESPRGKEVRSRRPIEVEAVFGRLKHNWGFRRFLLRGKEKVKTEWGILCIAHNMAKATVC